MLQFSIPEACLIADTIEYFVANGYKDIFSPAFVAQDVSAAISHVHTSGKFYRAVLAEPERFLPAAAHSSVRPMLQRLRRHGRKTFLLTNSPHWFVDGGMRHLLGERWESLFDVVVCSAAKVCACRQARRARAVCP